MDESDVEELTAAVGEGISHSYIARLLAKEIETCDPFNQLVADDVHHLTCDVLENWQDERIRALLISILAWSSICRKRAGNQRENIRNWLQPPTQAPAARCSRKTLRPSGLTPQMRA